jgi:repressor LexA
MTDLTPRQSQILHLIRQALTDTGMPPTRAEIAQQLGFRSPNAAEERDSLREQLGLPLIGRVAGGRPILADEHIIDRLPIDASLFKPRPHYLLKVVGMSMQGAGIIDGDLVAVHRTAEVRNRQIVVARLENDVTVKRYRQEGSIVWLMPENAEFEPLRVDLREQQMLIEGVVVGVLRLNADDVHGRRAVRSAA